MGRDAKLKKVQVEVIKKQIIKAQDMVGYCSGRLNAFDCQMVKDQDQFDEIKNTYNKHIEAMQNAKAKNENLIANLELKILDLEAKPVKQPNGKIKCQYCEKEFSPQNIKRHEVKCKKTFDKETEKAKLMAKLEELRKEELIPVEIPEVEKLPTIENEIALVTEVKEIATARVEKLEAELEQKEGE